jgi:hypothetical protein
MMACCAALSALQFSEDCAGQITSLRQRSQDMTRCATICWNLGCPGGCSVRYFQNTNIRYGGNLRYWSSPCLCAKWTLFAACYLQRTNWTGTGGAEALPASLLKGEPYRPESCSSCSAFFNRRLPILASQPSYLRYKHASRTIGSKPIGEAQESEACHRALRWRNCLVSRAAMERKSVSNGAAGREGSTSNQGGVRSP